MARRRLLDRSVLLPWERQRSLLLRLGLGRARPFVVAAVALAACLALAAHEQRRTGLRVTRAALTVAHAAIDRYRSDRDGACPRRLDELVAGGYLARAPVDGWGRPLRLVCPARNDPASYDLSSDGPDGEPGGLDRIE